MISPETIARVKDRTDIVALIGETVRLVRRGRSFVGLCPFHKEKSPSFHVNPDRGMFHCFGCKESGSAVDFVMKIEGYTFPEAIRVLAERYGIEVAETSTDAERREAAAARKAKDDLYTANNVAGAFFERSLRGPSAHPLARYAIAELTRRGLTPGDGNTQIEHTLQAFRIGYAPYGWDALGHYLKQQGISPIAGEKVGLLVPRSSGSGHYDRFRHRLMFAVTDVLGRVIGWSGRALPDPSPDEIAAHKIVGPGPSAEAPAKYINTPESPIYTKGEHLFGLYQARQSVRQEGEAILVEGNFDVVSLHARGFTTAVAPLGTAFTGAQAKLLKRFAPNVILLFDGDNAGRKATRAARAPCKEGGLYTKVAALPAGIDPDELVRKQGPAALASLLKNAMGILEYLIDDALNGEAFRGASLNEQRARIKAVTVLLAGEDDPNMRAMVKTYADQLSSKLIVQGRAPASLRELELSIEEATMTSARRVPLPLSQVTAPPEQARSRSQEDAIVQAILGALFDFPELIEDQEVEEALNELDGDAALTIAALRQIAEAASMDEAAHAINAPDAPDRNSTRSLNKGIYADDFLAQIPPSIHPFALGRLASPKFEAVSDARFELLGNARKLKRLSLTRENAAVVDLPNKVEAQGDIDSVNALLLETVRRARQKRGLT